MTQHSPNNRNSNNTTNTMSYSHKVRGTHKRVSRVRVSTVGKVPVGKAPEGKVLFPEKQHRSCPRCKESTNSMKILNARVGRIEQLVDVLAKTTRGLASISKRDDRFVQNTLRFRGIDLTRCTLEELQKLVVTTTNIMVPTNTNNLNTKKSNQNLSTNLTKDTTLSDITTTTNNEKKVLHSEPTEMEDIKIISNSDSLDRTNQQPTQPILPAIIGPLKLISLRQDSGFAEPEPPKDIIKPSID